MPRIRRHLDKVAWADAMASLIALRLSGSVGEVIDFIAAQSHMRLPEEVEEREKKLAETGPEPVEGEARHVNPIRQLRAAPFGEVLALERIIERHTPFATPHGVNGAAFAHDLAGGTRGWGQEDARDGETRD